MKVAVVGAGVYGLHVARLLGGRQYQVDVFEKEGAGMQGASKLNQARVHGGYHYPRSIHTAARSQKNYVNFIAEFSSCIVGDFKAIYAIAKDSKVSPEKFWHLSKMIGAPIKVASEKDLKLFDKMLIAAAFEVNECAFNSNLILAQILERMPLTVTLRNNIRVLDYNLSHYKENSGSEVYLNCEQGNFGPYDVCINATYGELFKNTSPSDALIYEVCELMRVKVPKELYGFAITVMDGPFFSLTPWPVFGENVLSHVRFTPHSQQINYQTARDVINLNNLRSRFELAVRDCERYMPLAKEIEYLESKYVVKTILKSRDFDDARPILAQVDKQVLNLIGSKIDNIYDIEEVLLKFIERNSHH